MAEYIVSVDIGTQGCKAALFDGDLERVAVSFVPLDVCSLRVGVAWQEPLKIYEGFLAAIRMLLAKSCVKPQEIAVLGIDGQMAGIMGVDTEGEAVTVYDSWLDTRCSRYVEWMKEQCGQKATQITGGPISFTHGPKILWLKHEKPELYKKVCKFVTIGAYITGRITGLRGEESFFDHTGMQYSGFGDNLRLEWSDELLGRFGVEKNKMARILSPFEVAGKITSSFAAESGLVPGTPVIAGCGDTAASIYGTNVLETGALLDCAGTASVLCSKVDAYAPDTANQVITLMRAPQKDQWYPMAYINGGGLCVRWGRDQLSGPQGGTYEELEKEALDVPAGSDGLYCIPHFAGRVLPYHPNLRGSFVGMSWNHTRGHLYRSILEGIAYEYAFYLSILKKMYPGYAFQKLYTMGGGARSKLFGQIKADVLGVDVAVCEEVDTALRGTAKIAAKAVGILQGTEDNRNKKTELRRQEIYIKANEGCKAEYAEMTEGYQSLLENLETFYRNRYIATDSEKKMM